jgi:hypothetical protein
MKMAVINPSQEAISIIIDDLADLIKQVFQYLFSKNEIYTNYNDKYFKDVANIIKKQHVLYLPLPDDDIELEMIKLDQGLMVKWGSIAYADEEDITMEESIYGDFPKPIPQTMIIKIDEEELM